MDGTLYFADGSRLEFTERIWIEHARPVKRDYRYQYVRAQVAIFSYDNAPHHPQLLGFPHHKHVGRKTMPASEPTLKQVLTEVTSMLPTALDLPQREPQRRRRPKSNKY
jgi:Family of unknown function (DUF6516)